MEEKKGIPAFIIDSSALKDIFEGKNKGAELLKKFEDMKDKGMTIKAMTPMASFLRAIWLADPETKVQSIQKTLKFLEIGYSTADFKNEEAVRGEIISIIKLISKMGSKDGN
jgi:hypothetical protein